MTIIFEGLTTNYGTGVLRTQLRIRGGDATNYGDVELGGYAIEGSGTSLRMGEGHVGLTPLRLKVLPPGAYGLVELTPFTVSAAASSSLSPAVGIGTLGQFDLFIAAAGFTVRSGDAVLTPSLRLFASDATAVGRLQLPLAIAAIDQAAEPKKQALLVSSPGALLIEVQADASLPPKILVDGIALNDIQLHQAIYVLLEQLGLGDQLGHVFDAIKRIAEQIDFNDRALVRVRQIITEIIGLHAAERGALYAAIRMLDTLGLQATPTTMVQALAVVNAVFRLLDNTLAPNRTTIAEAIGFLDALDTDVLAAMLAGDTFGLSMQPVNTLLLTAIGADTVGFSATGFTILQILKALESGVEFAVTLSTGDEGYTTWVMNAESQAFYTYENYPFNSYAQIGDQIFGASEDGIYLLEGDTDDGDPIAARVRTGLLNFGSNQSKRMEKFYFGMTTDGTMLLKVVTTSPEGDKIAYTYRMNERPVEATQEKRVSIGRGLQSVYWQFELTNEDGADFEIADMTLLPMVLASRVRRS